MARNHSFGSIASLLGILLLVAFAVDANEVELKDLKTCLTDCGTKDLKCSTSCAFKGLQAFPCLEQCGVVNLTCMEKCAGITQTQNLELDLKNADHEVN